ncbi:MAG: sigma-54-dependent transcriptional regulator [Alphaproteobacteria bacterium]
MRLLIVGILDGQLSAATRIATDRGAKVAHVTTIDAALDHLRAGRGADLLMVDVALDIRRLIEALNTEHIVVPIVACGIGNDARAAVEAIRAGAKEYIPLPPDAELIGAVLSAVADDRQQMVYRDEVMADVIALADQVAPSNASILITGESGVGKEVMAKYVHGKSLRADQPLISVNCAAIPENLLESELFGHEKGAFTGALTRRIGKFEEADGGTLLLDEISEMDIRLQAKLLRAIQEREIDRVGGSKPIRVDIRIMATSNRKLADAVKEGTFREDLFYRLNVVNLKIPPLRERPKDILALVEFFVAKYSQANGLVPKPLAERTKRALVAHPWNGNVRELENTMHRAVLLSTGHEITEEAIRLPDGSKVSEDPGAPNPMLATGPVAHAAHAAAQARVAAGGLVGRTVAEVERDLILDTLDHCLGNRTHAANILGISIRTLRNKLKQYTDEGIPVPSPGEARAATM